MLDGWVMLSTLSDDRGLTELVAAKSCDGVGVIATWRLRGDEWVTRAIDTEMGTQPIGSHPGEPVPPLPPVAGPKPAPAVPDLEDWVHLPCGYRAPGEPPDGKPCPGCGETVQSVFHRDMTIAELAARAEELPDGHHYNLTAFKHDDGELYVCLFHVDRKGNIVTEAGWSLAEMPSGPPPVDYAELQTETGMLQFTACEGESAALFTARGKDHDLSAEQLRRLSRQCLQVAAYVDAYGGSPETPGE